MPVLFWLDVSALGISIVLAVALTLMVLGGGLKRVHNRFFILFAALEAAWATSSLLLRLSLWLERGNPNFLLELAALALSTMGPVLLLFATRYLQVRTPWADLVAMLGLIVTVVLTIPLFQDKLIFNPRLHSNGSTFSEVSLGGGIAGLVPVLCIAWAAALFWQRRRQKNNLYLALSALVLLSGLVVGGIFEVRVPVLSFTNTLCAVILGYTIVSRQLFNPLRELTVNLERQVAERTAELTAANQEMESFIYSVSHDLRAPLASITGFSQALQEGYVHCLDADGQDFLQRIVAAGQRMRQIIEALLQLSLLSRCEMYWETVDLSALARRIADELRETQPERQVEFVIDQDVKVRGDPSLLQIGLENLLRNAWKFSPQHTGARIEFGVTNFRMGPTYFVRDNGVGFDMAQVDKLFAPFQRLHAQAEFAGTGVGLATVQRIIHRHGGRIWAESIPHQGATFYFTLGSRFPSAVTQDV